MAERKLLLADDSVTIQKVINLTFADEGIDVVAVGDGDSAIQRVAEEMPDIVLADVNMPGLNGYQVCERIRANERTRDIPVLLLVGTFEQFDDAEAVRVGANAHITKPFSSIRQLVNVVTDLIESNRAAQPEPAPEAAPQASEAGHTEQFEQEEVLETSGPFDKPIEREPAPDDQSTPLEPIGAESGPAEGRAEPSLPEAEDIDRLYRQSIGEEQLPADDELPDLGIDDEMIETSYTAPQPAGEDLDLITASEAETTEEQFDDTPSAGLTDLREEAARSPYETSDLSVSDLPEHEPPPGTAGMGETERLDPAMVDARMAEVNRRFEAAEQPSTIGEDTIPMEPRAESDGSATAEFEDIDLLDIPDSTEIEITSPAAALEKGGTKQIVTLSPELIETIAQRVVEKLSEKY